MKWLSQIFAIIIAAFLLFNSSSFAQDGHYYTSTTWKISTPGDNAEFNAMLKEWHDKVVAKNDKIVSEKVLRHAYGNDMRDWVFITEYASWADIDAAGEVQNKLIEEAWPNKDERKKFFDTFWKYVVTHSDEIYQESPELKK